MKKTHWDSDYQRSLSSRENARQRVFHWEGYPSSRDTKFSKTELLFRDKLTSCGSHPMAGQLFHDYVLVYAEMERFRRLLLRNGISRSPDKSKGPIGGRQITKTRKRMGI